MFEFIVIAILLMTFNMLDSVTTSIGLKQYPDKELKSEGNPFMRKLMKAHPHVAEISKQLMAIGLIVAVYIFSDTVKEGITVLRLMTILLGLVVLSNTYIVVIRAIKKRKVKSHWNIIQERLHLSDFQMYLVMCSTVIILATLINTAVGW